MERLLENHRAQDLQENTMSSLKEMSLDELRRLLSEQSGLSIFGKASSQRWMDAYRYSYALMESGKETLPTVVKLRASVKKQLPAELPLITEQEENLLKRALVFGGTTPLFVEEEMAPAESLIRRLWCSGFQRDDGQIFLRVAEPLIKPMLKIMAEDAYREMRAKVFAMSATLHSMIYLHGMLYAQPAINHLSEHLLPVKDEAHLRALHRYILAEYDYCRDSQGNLVLMHPGVVQPEKMLSSLSNASYQSPDYTREMIIGGIGELLKEEEAATAILRSELGFALQPGYNAATMVNDLKLLIKQGASHEQLAELLRDKLAVRMTPQLENALRRAETDTVRWQSAPSGRLN